VRRCSHRYGDVRVEVGARSAWLYGAGLAGVCDELGVPQIRDWHPDRKGVLLVPIDWVADVLAIIEHREGRTVESTAVDR
jgi:hypothetical protein